MPMKFYVLLFLIFPVVVFADKSTCYGTTSKGRLVHGVQLPISGPNYVGYHSKAIQAGRTYVHSAVKDIFVKSFDQLEILAPEKVFKYAETGFANGGRFKPHKTHQNGLSIDYMTPVINESGRSVHLPTLPSNRFGYDIEFDEDGVFGNYQIDYTAMSAHLVALHKAAKHAGYDLWRVIFDPKLQPPLFETEYGAYLKANIQFSKRRSWVRHDEHYHVDFAIPCK